MFLFPDYVGIKSFPHPPFVLIAGAGGEVDCDIEGEFYKYSESYSLVFAARAKNKKEKEGEWRGGGELLKEWWREERTPFEGLCSGRGDIVSFLDGNDVVVGC